MVLWFFEELVDFSRRFCGWVLWWIADGEYCIYLGLLLLPVVVVKSHEGLLGFLASIHHSAPKLMLQWVYSIILFNMSWKAKLCLLTVSITQCNTQWFACAVDFFICKFLSTVCLEVFLGFCKLISYLKNKVDDISGFLFGITDEAERCVHKLIMWSRLNLLQKILDAWHGNSFMSAMGSSATGFGDGFFVSITVS